MGAKRLCDIVGSRCLIGFTGGTLPTNRRVADAAEEQQFGPTYGQAGVCIDQSTKTQILKMRTRSLTFTDRRTTTNGRIALPIPY